MANQNKQNWTVFFVIKSTSDTVKYAIETINEIRQIDYSETVTILLCLYLTKGNISAVVEGDVRRIRNEKDMFTTVFYKVVKDTRAGKYLNYLSLLDEKETFDITNPDDLRKFFEGNISKDRCDDKYMIFTWDHGNGFAVFSDAADRLVTPSLIEVGLPRLKILPISQPFGAEEKILTMDELAKAIQSAFEKQKVDLLVMMNCYMQSMDSGYALRKHVKYLVAPESDMYYNGYNYPYFFRRLLEHPEQPASRLARCLVNSFETKVYIRKEEGVVARASTAVFANKLNYYSAMAKCLGQLADLLDKELVLRRPEIIMARCTTIPLNESSQYVDITTLIKNIRKTLGNKWQVKLLDEILCLQNKIVIAKYVGLAFTLSIRNPFPTGLSVFFPIKEDQFMQMGALKLFLDTSFAKEINWNRFVFQFTEKPLLANVISS